MFNTLTLMVSNIEMIGMNLCTVLSIKVYCMQNCFKLWISFQTPLFEFDDEEEEVKDAAGPSTTASGMNKVFGTV